MGKDLNGKEIGAGIVQQKNGRKFLKDLDKKGYGFETCHKGY